MGGVGAAQARETSRRITKGSNGSDETLRREGSRPCGRGQAPDRVGRPADAGARRDPGTLRARTAAQRASHLRVPARDDGNGEPHAHAEGRRRRRRALRVQSALDAGRRRSGARRGVRHLGLRDQRRGPRHVLLAHRGCGRPQAAPDDGRRRRRDRRPALGPPRAARRHHRRHGGDDHRRHPAEGAGGRGQARIPDHRRERRRDEAPLRQPLRHRPVDRSTGSSARRTSSSPARRSSSPATAGSGAASRRVRAAWARR